MKYFTSDAKIIVLVDDTTNHYPVSDCHLTQMKSRNLVGSENFPNKKMATKDISRCRNEHKIAADKAGKFLGT